MARIGNWLVGTAALAGAAVALRRAGRQPHGMAPAGRLSGAAPNLPEEDRSEGGGTVHLMMEDGSVVEAAGDIDPDGRLRYLADNLLSPPEAQP